MSAWRELGATPRVTSDEVDLVDEMLEGVITRGMATTMSVFQLVEPTSMIERVVLARVSLVTWIAFVARRDSTSVLLTTSDDAWIRELRDHVQAARDAPNPAAQESAHASIVQLEARILQEARDHLARSTALIALLLQNSLDANEELDRLQGVVAGAAELQFKAIEEALARRGVTTR